MDLADFPNLKKFNVVYLSEEVTPISGDIRDIDEHDFPGIEMLLLPPTVYGGHKFEFQRIGDVPSVMQTVCRPRLKRALARHFLAEDRETPLKWRLSSDSPEFYRGAPKLLPPFFVVVVQAGSRVGYRWFSPDYNKPGSISPPAIGSPCEVNWIDPEPDKESSDYETYLKELQALEQEVGSFKGFHEPPTEEEYHRVLIEYEHRIDTRQTFR